MEENQLPRTSELTLVPKAMTEEIKEALIVLKFVD